MASGNTTDNNASPARRGSGDSTAALGEFAKLAGATIVNGQPTNSAGQRVYTVDVGLGANAATMTAPGAARSLFNGQAVTSQIDAATGAQGFRKFYTDLREEVLEMTHGYTNSIFGGNGRGDVNAGLRGVTESRFIRNADMGMLGGIGAAVSGGQHVSFLEDAKTNTIAAQIFDATQNRVRAMKWSDLDPAFQGGRTGAALDEALKMSFAREAEVGARYTTFRRDKNGVLGAFATGGTITSIEDEASNLDAKGEAKVKADLGAGNREAALPPGLQPGNGVGDSARTDAERKRDQREEDRSLRMDRAWRAGVSAMLMLSRTMGQFGSGVDKVSSAVSGAVGGASTGATFGRWGAVIGGILGALPSIVKTTLGYMRAEGTLNANVGRDLLTDDQRKAEVVRAASAGLLGNAAIGYADTHSGSYGLSTLATAQKFAQLSQEAAAGHGAIFDALQAAGTGIGFGETMDEMLPKIIARARELRKDPLNPNNKFFLDQMRTAFGSDSFIQMLAEHDMEEGDEKRGENFVNTQKRQEGSTRAATMANNERVRSLRAASDAEADLAKIEKNGGFQNGKQIADFFAAHPELKLNREMQDALDKYYETGNDAELLKTIGTEYRESLDGGMPIATKVDIRPKIQKIIEYTKRSGIDANNEGADDKAFDNSLYNELGFQNVLFKYKTDAMKQQSYREQISSISDKALSSITSGEASANEYADFLLRVSSDDYSGGASYSGLAYGSNRGKVFASAEGGEILKKIVGHVNDSGRSIDAFQLHRLIGTVFTSATSLKQIRDDESLFALVDDIIKSGRVQTTQKQAKPPTPNAAKQAAQEAKDKAEAEKPKTETASVTKGVTDAESAVEKATGGAAPNAAKQAAQEAKGKAEAEKPKTETASVTEGVTNTESAVEKATGASSTTSASTEPTPESKPKKRARRRMRPDLESIKKEARERLDQEKREQESLDLEDRKKEENEDWKAQEYRYALESYQEWIDEEDAKRRTVPDGESDEGGSGGFGLSAHGAGLSLSGGIKPLGSLSAHGAGLSLDSSLKPKEKKKSGPTTDADRSDGEDNKDEWHNRAVRGLQSLDDFTASASFSETTKEKVAAAEAAAKSGLDVQPHLPSQGGTGSMDGGGSAIASSGSSDRNPIDMHNEISVNVNLAGVTGDEDKGRVIGSAVGEAIREKMNELVLAIYEAAPGAGTYIA